MRFQKRLLVILLVVFLFGSFTSAIETEEIISNPSQSFEKSPSETWQKIESNPELLKNRDLAVSAFNEEKYKAISIIDENSDLMESKKLFSVYDKNVFGNEILINNYKNAKSAWLKNLNIEDEGAEIKKYDGRNITTKGKRGTKIKNDTFEGEEYPGARAKENGEIVLKNGLRIGNSRIVKGQDRLSINSLKNGYARIEGKEFSGSNMEIWKDGQKVNVRGTNVDFEEGERKGSFTGKVTFHEDFQSRAHMTLGKGTKLNLLSSADDREIGVSVEEETEYYDDRKFCALIEGKSCVSYNPLESFLYAEPRQGNKMDLGVPAYNPIDSMDIPLIEGESEITISNFNESIKQKAILDSEEGMMTTHSQETGSISRNLRYYARNDEGEICRHNVDSEEGIGKSSESILCMEDSSYYAAKKARETPLKHSAQVEKNGVAEYYGSNIGRSEKTKRRQKSLYSGGKAVSCIGWAKMCMQMEEMDPEDKKAFVEAYREHEASAPFIYDEMQEEQGWESVLIYPGGDDAVRGGLDSRVYSNAEEGNYKIPTEDSSKNINMNLESFISEYDPNTNDDSRAKEKIEVLKRVPFAAGEFQYGGHAFVLSNGKVVENHYSSRATSKHVFESSPIEEKLSRGQFSSLSMPPGAWERAKNSYCRDNPNAKICEEPGIASQNE